MPQSPICQVLRWLGGTRASWLREGDVELGEHCAGGYCTVRGPMNSCVPIQACRDHLSPAERSLAPVGVSRPAAFSVASALSHPWPGPRDGRTREPPRPARYAVALLL